MLGVLVEDVVEVQSVSYFLTWGNPKIERTCRFSHQTGGVLHLTPFPHAPVVVSRFSFIRMVKWAPMRIARLDRTNSLGLRAAGWERDQGRPSGVACQI
jgi:hypothetical protein